MSGETTIKELALQLARKWLEMDKNDITSKEIQDLVEQKKYDKLLECLQGELAFGNAGVRARVGAGFTRLNDLTILQLSNGFATHLLATTLNKNKSELNMVIGYDARHNSHRFAQFAANVFVQNGIRVHMFNGYVPTSIVSFAVAELKCDAGLMITASHNPKDDNGYKAFWNNGAQILAPHDGKICEIARSEELKAGYWESRLQQQPLLLYMEPLMGAYFQKESGICCLYKSLNTTSQLRITYSAFNGVGSKFARQMFQEFGFPAANISYVKEQNEPSRSAPTVPFPNPANPEEGHRFLQLCFGTADANNAQLILANDLDAGRLQVAEKQPNGKWHVFTGNEMGTLASWWIWTQWRQRNPDEDPSHVYILNSAVSSQIVAKMAKEEGFQNDVSLTGFKWIGNLADKLRAEGKTVILAWDESNGFSMGTTHDKDGISAAAVFAEMANWLNTQKEPSLTLQQQLFAIYRQYGFHLTKKSSRKMSGLAETRKLFGDLRGNGITIEDYTKDLGASGRVQFVRDLTTSLDNHDPSKPVYPPERTSQMITFTLDTGSIVTLRASETKPEVKIYIEVDKQESELPERALNQLDNDVAELLHPYGTIEQEKSKGVTLFLKLPPSAQFVETFVQAIEVEEEMTIGELKDKIESEIGLTATLDIKFCKSLIEPESDEQTLAQLNVTDGYQIVINLTKDEKYIIQSGLYVPSKLPAGVAIGLVEHLGRGELVFVVAAKKKKAEPDPYISTNLKEAAKNSAHIAWYVAENRASNDFFTTKSAMIDIADGEIDGPSGGAAILTAITSLAEDKPIRPKTAMTGGIEPNGRITAVGAINEKTIAAAYKADIDLLLLPKLNEGDFDFMKHKLATINPHIKVALVESFDEVRAITLDGKTPKELGLLVWPESMQQEEMEHEEIESQPRKHGRSLAAEQEEECGRTSSDLKGPEPKKQKLT